MRFSLQSEHEFEGADQNFASEMKQERDEINDEHTRVLHSSAGNKKTTDSNSFFSKI